MISPSKLGVFFFIRHIPYSPLPLLLQCLRIRVKTGVTLVFNTGGAKSGLLLPPNLFPLL